MSRIMPVLNQLYANKRVTLSFQTAEARENFRQSLYKIKKTQDDALLAVLDEEKMTLGCHQDEMYLINDVEAPKDTYALWMMDETKSEYKFEMFYIATFWMYKRKKVEFEILSVEDIEPEKESNDGRNREERVAKVSKDLGAPDSNLSPSGGNSDSEGGAIQEDPQSRLEREKPRSRESGKVST